MRNIFLEKSYAKCCGDTLSRPFSKKSQLSIYLDNILKFYQLIFIDIMDFYH